MIKLHGLFKSYTTSAGSSLVLNDINLSVIPGEILGIIGESGAGKTTLLHCINLLERPDQGQVIVNSQDLTCLSEPQLRIARRKIGMIFQDFNLLSSRTVYENIAFPLEIVGYNAKKIRSTITPLIALTGLTQKVDHYPAQLSGGQKQRVAIARALANEPILLLCDEATSSLDPKTTESILNLLRDINKKLGLTIILITHEMNVIKNIAERVALIDQGRLIEKASIVDFFTKPQSNLAKEYVKSALKHSLPEALHKKLLPSPIPNGNPVLRIFFHGAAASKPLISHLIQRIGLEINILHAGLEFIGNELMGIMVIEITGNAIYLSSGIQYLESHNVKVEVIGYVEPTVV
jgi:D-methionine transport system ATP-binding protein